MRKTQTENRFVQKVCRYIEENIHTILYAEEVAEHFSVNRRKLRNLFHAAAGCTVQEYINKARLNKLKQLIQDTPDDAPLYEYALQVGFEYDSSLANFIRRQTGKTLLQFRSEIHSDS